MNFLKQIQAFFPGAAGFAIIGDAVWVRCVEFYVGERLLPAGNVRLAGSPGKAALAEKIVAYWKD